MNHVLKRIGFWYSEREPNLPMPIANSDNLDDASRKKLISYLKSGEAIVFWRGFSSCRICNKCIDGTKDISDGEYVWPEGLPHYLEEHKVGLPDEFVKKAIS